MSYLGVGLGKRAAVFDQLQESWRVLGLLDTSGSTAEGRQFPAVAGLDGGALGRCEAHSGEICKQSHGVKCIHQLSGFQSWES